MTLTRALIISLVLILAASLASAQEAPSPNAPRPTETTASSASGTLVSEIPAANQPYPDSADGIKSQMANLFRVWSPGDKERFAAQLDSFALADPQAWLAQSFGPEKGAALLPDYQTSLEKFKSHLSWICGNWGNAPDLMLKVEPSELPRPAEDTGEEANLPRPVAPVQIENFMFTLTMGQRIAERSTFSFVYTGGSFRVLGGTYPFWNEPLQAIRRPPAAPSRIRMGGNVQAAQITHVVQPIYPLVAKQNHIQGTVVLHAIIGKDGKIKHLEFVGGPPELKEASMDAVQKWVYKPTLLLGNPVEVDTTISVVFALGRR